MPTRTIKVEFVCECGATDKEHYAKGLCRGCYDKKAFKEKQTVDKTLA